MSTKIGTEISQAKSQPAAPALDERRPFNAPEVEQARGQFVAALRLHVVVLFDSGMAALARRDSPELFLLLRVELMRADHRRDEAAQGRAGLGYQATSRPQ